MKKEIEEIDEIAELENELKKADLKLKILKSKSDFSALKKAMNTSDPIPRVGPSIDPY